MDGGREEGRRIFESRSSKEQHIKTSVLTGEEEEEGWVDNSRELWAYTKQ
jgi:hypothetical protein